MKIYRIFTALILLFTLYGIKAQHSVYSTELKNNESTTIVSPQLSVKDNLTDNYHPFLNSSKWLSVNNDFEGYINSFYYMDGDTIINNLLYYTIKYKIIKLPNIYNNPWFSGQGINCYLREDIENKKIYKLQTKNKSESIFYDFNLRINDKMQNDTSYTLFKIDTVHIAAGFRKRFNFKTYNDYATAIWIEGVGNITDPLVFNDNVSQYINTICAYQFNEIIYDQGETNGVSCTDFKETFSGLEDVEINTCKLYPNPTKDKFSISISNGNLKSIRIIDVYGRIVTDQGNNLDLHYLNLNISNLQNGLYFCVVCTENETGTFKIIKE